MNVFLASGNTHKLIELAELCLLHELPVNLYSAEALGGMPEVDENAVDYAGNARLKAVAVLPRAPKGDWVLADDSGLEVDALDGAPGVHSARYAEGGDEANNAKLLKALAHLPADQRTARFRCVLVLMRGGSQCAFEIYEGTCEGRIALEPTGAEGFGYDPLFIPDGHEESFASLGAGIKQRLSHRSMAVAAWASVWRPWMEDEDSPRV